jgi:hypothetical protein
MIILAHALPLYGVETAASITADLAIYPEAGIDEGGGFAPVTGIYTAAEARITGDFSLIWPVPFGDNPLVSGNTLIFSTQLELTPVSIAPAVKLTFTPIAFLVFNAGGRIGGAWDFIGVQGLASYDAEKRTYISLSPFSSFHYELWAEGIFQFDLAALLPGEWNHVVFLASYKAMYEAITRGGENGKPWVWQGLYEKANGWKYISSVVIGYQMPLVLQMAAVQAEFEGYYSPSSYHTRYEPWNPSFVTISVSPILNFQFTEKQSLLVQFRFRSRRGYEDASSGIPVPEREHQTRQWYFDRIALSYTYRF